MNTELKVIEIKSKYKYIVLDLKNNRYELSVEFFDTDVLENDMIYVNNETFNDMISYPTNFGKIDSKYGRDLSTLDEINQDKELLIIKRDNNKVILKRLYG